MQYDVGVGHESVTTHEHGVAVLTHTAAGVAAPDVVPEVVLALNLRCSRVTTIEGSTIQEMHEKIAKMSDKSTHLSTNGLNQFIQN